MFRAKDFSELVDTSGEGLLDPVVVDLGELVIQRLESCPFVWSEDEYKGWEVETSMVTHIFVLTGFRGVNVEIDDFVINIRSFFESANEWPNILKSSTSHQLRSWIFEESIVNLR